MLVRLLRRHLQPYTGLLLCVLLLQFAQVMASLYLPTLNADIIDKGVATGDTGYIWRMGAFMLAVSVRSGCVFGGGDVSGGAGGDEYGSGSAWGGL